jgi:uncharacterized protein
VIATQTIVRQTPPNGWSPSGCHPCDPLLTLHAMSASETIHVPPREGRAVTVPEGGVVRIVDRDGGQVADMWAFNAHDVREHLSAMHTRAGVDRLFPLVGEAFLTTRRRPILIFERDDTPAIHDMLIAPCDPERYEGLGVEGWHASCEENLLRTMADLGHGDIWVPQSLNLFMNIPVDDGMQLGWEPAQTRAGDSVTFRAVMDAIVVVSACPQDIVPINNCDPTAIDIELPAS